MPIKGDFDSMWNLYPKGFSHDPSIPRELDEERIARLNVKLRNDIGGTVNDPAFVNLCAVRLSYVMNRSGLKIPNGMELKWYKKDPNGKPHKLDVRLGGDNYYYAHGVIELYHYISQKFGKPDLEIAGPFAVWKNGIVSENPENVVSISIPPELKGKKGILVFLVKYWKDAQGHATLWNGEKSVDNNYFEFADKVMLWEVKSNTFSNSVRIHNLNDAIRINVRPIPQDSGQ